MQSTATLEIFYVAKWVNLDPGLQSELRVHVLKESYCPLVSGTSMLQIGHFWLFLKLFVQLDNRFTSKLPKLDDRLTYVIKTKNKNDNFSISSTPKAKPYQRRLVGVVIARAEVYDLQ